jgi:hypothetical protein
MSKNDVQEALDFIQKYSPHTDYELDIINNEEYVKQCRKYDASIKTIRQALAQPKAVNVEGIIEDALQQIEGGRDD